jgi:hypothetical protein
VKVADGAPGFKFTTNAGAGELMLQWVEYDGDQLEDGFYSNTTWPSLSTNVSKVDCGTNCA